MAQINLKLSENLTKAIKSILEKRKNPCLFLLCEISENSVSLIKNKIGNQYFDEFDVMLTTQWWWINEAYKIAKILRNSTKKLNFIVPYMAKSAWTLISLSADEICLWKLWELWPLDVQVLERDDNWQPVFKSALEEFMALEQVKSHTINTLDSFNTIISNKTKLNIKDIINLSSIFTWQTSWKLYEKVDLKKLWNYSRALEMGKQYWIKILTQFINKDINTANNIVQNLVYWYPSHSFIIDDLEWIALWLPIKDCREFQIEMDKLYDELKIFMDKVSDMKRNNNLIFDICELYRYSWWKISE